MSNLLCLLYYSNMQILHQQLAINGERISFWGGSEWYLSEYSTKIHWWDCHIINTRLPRFWVKQMYWYPGKKKPDYSKIIFVWHKFLCWFVSAANQFNWVLFRLILKWKRKPSGPVRIWNLEGRLEVHHLDLTKGISAN